MGSIGGKKGFGASKRRSIEHYKRIAALSWKDKRRPLSERFWEKVDKRGPEECWPWIGCVSPAGYGRFSINNKAQNSNRIAYELHHGARPDKFVLHHCDNPRCCNPNHLFLGTQTDNCIDMRNKGRGRGPKGEKNFSHKLKESNIPNIRSDTRSASVIAKDYGVTKAAITHAKSRRTWKHIP